MQNRTSQKIIMMKMKTRNGMNWKNPIEKKSMRTTISMMIVMMMMMMMMSRKMDKK